MPMSARLTRSGCWRAVAVAVAEWAESGVVVEMGDGDADGLAVGVVAPGGGGDFGGEHGALVGFCQFVEAGYGGPVKGGAADLDDGVGVAAAGDPAGDGVGEVGTWDADRGESGGGGGRTVVAVEVTAKQRFP